MKLKPLFLLVSLILLMSFKVFAQIPEGYYDSVKDLSGESLKTALYQIIKNHTEFPYTSSSTDTWDIIKESDRDTSNTENVVLFYSGWSVNAAQEYNNGAGWSREHIWAKSHGDFGTDLGVGTDLHHLRPADISVNSARGNDDFDVGGSLYIDGDGATECKTDNDSWEPRDAVKGDVARMLFYMAVRYEGDNGEPDLELVDQVDSYDLNKQGKGFHGKLSTLLEWHKADPVDSFEIRRNDIIYSYQKNRNPFIDHPEFTDLIWIPTDVNNLKEGNIKIFPNPADNFLNILVPDGIIAYCQILDMKGGLVISQEIGENENINTGNFTSGIYVVNVLINDRIFTSKIAVKH
ncbi:endonuclease [uncultured Sunxiuqinia sp.]|uniref:endonuclease n=1 Tax=uncultured Sunxiuqinia sp. TaxID=1573825 RepID=UPI002AA7FF93|nr:endonuclease [uncultured Sunxiuqinia sp.]